MLTECQPPFAVGVSRRVFLSALGGAASGLALGIGQRAWAAAPRAKVLGRTVVSQQPALYHGWPTLARRRKGELLLVCSGGREAHVCPFGRVEMMRSRDDGRTWTWPQVLLDGPIDDRDSGVVETAKGSLLVTTFTSLAFEPGLAAAEKAAKGGEQGAWPAEQLKRWQAARDRIGPEERQKELGVWMIRSTDGGVTWSARYDCQVNSPHGPIQLSDGRLLYAGKDLWRDGRVGVCESTDDGQSWRWLATIPPRDGDKPADYHELHAVETADKRIVVHLRNHNKANERETLQTESSDGGRSWAKPRPIGVWGLPSHLLRLADDRLLMSYGHRRQPLGNQARVSADHGRTWSEPIVLSDGRLLYAGKDLWRDGRVGVCESADDGQSWRWLATIPPRDGDKPADYHELHAVETADKRIVVHLRNHNQANERETLQTESSDGGRSWAKPRPIGVWGLPSHLLRLADDRLLMSYGHRRQSLGNQARVSADHGRTWSEPILLSDDGITGDLGYPSTVQLADGLLLTAWYEVLRGSPKAVLRQARWMLEA